MWQDYFKVVNIEPGRVDTALFGLVDFSSPKVPLKTIQALYEADCPYLELTPLGRKQLYGQPTQEKETAKEEVSIKPEAGEEALSKPDDGDFIQGNPIDPGRDQTDPSGNPAPRKEKPEKKTKIKKIKP